MSWLGDLERFLSDLYPYRVPLTGAGLLLALLVAWLGVRRGWHAVALNWTRAHRVVAPVLGAVVLVALVVGGNYLLSPLWERSTLDEASPLLAASERDRTAVEATAIPSPTPSVTPEAEGTAVPGATTEATASPTTPASTTAEAEATGSVDTTSDAVSEATPGASSEVTPSATATAASSEPFTARVVSDGEFSGADDFHFGRGRALIIETAPGKYVLRFEEFSVRNGPDLFVYLSSDPGAPSGDGVKLGALKATDGAFNYEIPPGVDVSGLGYAMIWCDQFAVLFATAPLTS